MKFSNETRINPEAVEDDIPVIHGNNYYIDEQGFVSTYNNSFVSVFDKTGSSVTVQTIKPITEFIYVVNQKLAYKTSQGILVTDIPALKEHYRGGFQGIVGFDEATTEYQFINSNSTTQSEQQLEARINDNKQLEIYLPTLDIWTTPLGEFRCFIDDVLYNIGYDTVLPNAFGEQFTITLLGWTTVSVTPDTNYIRDAFIAGNTLYLSTRQKIIGSTPFVWSEIDTSQSTVIWSEDSRLSNTYFVGNSTASNFYMISYNTSCIYWVDGTTFDILQEYQHKQPILGSGSIDKFTIALVDKEAVTIIGAYVSLNTWLMKTRLYFKFNQLSAYEEMTTQYLREEVVYVRDIDTLVIKSKQRTAMMLYILGNKVLSGCHTSDDIVAGEFEAYLPTDQGLYLYTRVEESGDYTEIDRETGVVNFDSFIYIGSDLEPDVGGSTMRDTEIMYEGKIAIVEGDEVSVESSGDVPADARDLPVRTNQDNPENWWYLYTKTLRYPISYTDWIKISLMPTTKVFNIRLVKDPTKKEGNK